MKCKPSEIRFPHLDAYRPHRVDKMGEFGGRMTVLLLIHTPSKIHK